MQFAHNGYYKGSIPFGLSNFTNKAYSNIILKTKEVNNYK